MPKIIDEAAVFKAVLALLVARGYERTTTSAMAAVANMHEATLFRKYGSKIGLIERAIDQQLSATPLSAVRYSGNLRADLVAILEAYMATVATYGEIMPLLLVEIPRHPELKRTLLTPLANIQGIIHILDRYQQEGLLKNEPALTCVNALLSPLMVNEMYRRVYDDLPAPAVDLQAYVDAFYTEEDPNLSKSCAAAPTVADVLQLAITRPDPYWSADPRGFECKGSHFRI